MQIIMRGSMHAQALMTLALTLNLSPTIAKSGNSISSANYGYSFLGLQQTIRGKILDEQGQAIGGVTVRNLTAGTTAQSAPDGNFSIAAKPGDQLEFSSIGFDRQTVSVNGSAPLAITLVNRSTVLEDVTVTGYTNYSRKQSANVSTTVKAKDLEQVPMASVDQMLQGRVPGMSVMASSGQPGATASVVIRGVGSINGISDPLYVIDGIPIATSELKNFSANDFESVNVLRDATGKSLYGSRGSNGVIVITTKKGKSGQLTVNFNSQYGLSKLTRPKFQMMNTQQRLQFEEELGAFVDPDNNEGIGPGWTYSPKNPDVAGGTAAYKARAAQILDSLRGINVDWRGYFFRNGKFMDQQVNVSGGGEHVRFYSSAGYYKQEGVAVRSGLDRYTLKNNLDFDKGKLSGGVNVTLGYTNSKFTEGVGASRVGSSMASVYYALPYEYPYAPDGTLIHFGNEDDYFILDQREGSAGLERLLNSSSSSELFNTNVGLNLNYQLLPTLKVHTRLGIDYNTTTGQDYINPDSYYGSRDRDPTLGGKGLFAEDNLRSTNVISTTGLTYQNTFYERHNLELSAYFEYLYRRNRAFGYKGYGIDSRLPENPNGVTVSPAYLPAILGGRTKYALASYMALGRYTYDNRYSLTASYRYDGSSRVAEANRWHGFYSFGANWNIKEEEFLKSNEFIQGLSLRASYGTTASTINGDFNYLATFRKDITYGGETAIRPYDPGNPNYDWEYVDEFNAGFDLELFPSKRLRVAMDYYNKITKNMFFDQPISLTSGFLDRKLPLSTGKMRNRGLEMSLSGDVVKTADWGLTLGVNASYNKNTILYLSDALTEVLDGDTRIMRVGLPYGTYYAPEWAGVNPQTGDAQYYNRDGSITTEYDETAQAVTKSGSMFPKWVGGFNTTIRWKNLSLDALFAFVSDVRRWNNEDFYNENSGYMTSNQSIRMLSDRWKQPGDNAILQRIDIPRNYTSKDIQDASFLRLRNVNLVYQFPKTLFGDQKVIKGARIFFQGQNLLTWTSWRGLDPENSEGISRFNYPAPRTYTAGFSVNF
ncbi:SusC/RagA family TonB-linked outer membrane protein [Sphingobacterium puteale]|uniref:SusC/RagA family TonB-linked outer membrane protein n=1 Tax=Sphingobacterium puteale TaxID=2420510 RepID=UPI003D95C138